MDVTVVLLHIRQSTYTLVLKNESMLKWNKAEQKLQVRYSASRHEELKIWLRRVCFISQEICAISSGKLVYYYPSDCVQLLQPNVKWEDRFRRMGLAEEERRPCIMSLESLYLLRSPERSKREMSTGSQERTEWQLSCCQIYIYQTTIIGWWG